jgi:hypothetical protein
MQIAIMLIGTGVLIGICGATAILLVMGNRPKTPKAELLDCDWRSGMPIDEYDEIERRFDAAREDLRDYLSSIRYEPPPMPPCKPAREVGSIRYEHLGMTDREDER